MWSNTKPSSNDLYTILLRSAKSGGRVARPLSCKMSSFCLGFLPNSFGEIRDSGKHKPPLVSVSHCCEVLCVWDQAGPVILGSLRVHRTVTSSAGQRRTRVALLRFFHEIPKIHILYDLFETISCAGFNLKALFLSLKLNFSSRNDNAVLEENHPHTTKSNHSVFLHKKKS